MTARLILFVVAATALAGCGTTENSEATAPSKQRLVVRGAVVPDDPIMTPAAAKTTASPKAKTRTVSSASLATPVEQPLAEPAPPKKKPVVAASGSSSDSSSGPTGGNTVVADGTPAAPPVTDPGTAETAITPLATVEEAPATVTAEPAAAPPPAPGSRLPIDFKDMMNTTIAGFPLWMMVLAGIALAGALIFGLGGKRREKPSRDERAYEERSYDEREAEPA